jgi:hypothetical protein
MSFRLLLIAIWVVIAVYTGIVIANHGLNLLPIFFGDIAKMAWPGQFNLDFLCMLILSATWVSWRHNFSGAGMGLGLLALFGGASFLSVYLFILSVQNKGNVAAILLGQRQP